MEDGGTMVTGMLDGRIGSVGYAGNSNMYNTLFSFWG